MKRVAMLFCAGLLVPGCGGADDMDPGAQGCPGTRNPANPGFFCPTGIATAWELEDGVWAEVGPANLDCLGTPSTDMASAVDIDLAGTVEDYQERLPVASAAVEVFAGIDIGNVLASTTGDPDGNYGLTLPAGHTRVGFKVGAADHVETYLLNQYFDPDASAQDADIEVVSQLTADLLPALIGLQRTDGQGIVAAAFRDCDGNTVSDVVATVSGTSGVAEHLVGGQSYYFNDTLPTSHVVRQSTNSDGLFVVLELPEAATGYLQVWGFTAEMDPTVDDMILLSEMAAPVVGNAVISVSAVPLRN